nr:metalloregulator ArsR/SmtB family transcription factor [Ignatzschineria indica]
MLTLVSLGGKMNIQEMREGATEATAFLKKFGNEDRLLLLCHLSKGEYSVSALEELTGIQQPTLSQQLGVLREDNLVNTRRDGKWIYYSVDDPKVITLLHCIYGLFCSKEFKE